MARGYKLKDSKHVEGLKDLSEKLEKLGQQTGGKALRNAVEFSQRPTLREIGMAAPVGKRGSHKTYRGRTVPSGFLKKNIKRKSWIDRKWGSVKYVIGVSQEAFYGVQFLDVGWTPKGGSYIPGTHWFRNVFERNSQRSVATMKARLKTNIEKVAKS